MRRTALHLATSVLLATALHAAAAGELDTNAPGPPPPPHSYKFVTTSVTLHHLSPVEYFRGLLGMTPAERGRALASKPAADRTILLAKIREYEDMPREAREQRLLQTEIHWNLLALLPLDPAQRTERLKDVSPLYQPMILFQLAKWDEIPATNRQELLDKKGFLRDFVKWQDHSPPMPGDGLLLIPPAQRERWANELQWWQAQAADRRAELTAQFKRFLYSTGEEQNQEIQPLSPDERHQMEAALESYANLPAAQRRVCLDSFDKFASMDAVERNQFLQNAAKWEAMTSDERKLWRRLVNELPPMPPMPPGMHFPPMPPMPPGFYRPPVAMQREAGPPAVTNLAKATNTGQ